jgi:hypothetical protein
MYEGFNYTVGTNNPDPDGSVNGGNGLPATNVGGSPTGTSTGWRSSWGSTLVVTTGLTYSQGGNVLNTTGGAGTPNNATWGTDIFAYRNMTTDPFVTQRIGSSTSGNFGVDGTSLWFSVLARTSSTTAQAFRFKIGDGSSSNNLYFENTADKWTLNYGGGSASSSTGGMTVNTTALLVFRVDFAAGATDTVSLWVNPTLGGTPGTADASRTGITFSGLQNLNLRPTVANAMTIDELRMGTSYADVTPFTAVPEPSAAALSSLGLLALLRRRRTA